MSGNPNYPGDWSVRRGVVYRRDEYTCLNCRAEGGPFGDTELHAHHIVPKGAGGSDRIPNLATVCGDCHSRIHPDKDDLQRCRSPSDQPLENVEGVTPDHLTMFPLVQYEEDSIDKTQKPIRIGKSRYVVVTTTFGRIANYIVDCEEAVCDCPAFRKIQNEDVDGEVCNHMATVIWDQGPGAEMLREQLPDKWGVRAFDPDVHELGPQ